MPVLTIYNHGTGGSRTKETAKGEIVNIFGNGALGIEGTDFLITEGVGKRGSPHTQIAVEKVYGGAYAGIVHPEKVSPSKARMRENLSAAVASMPKRGLVKLFGGNDGVLQASGVGVDENVVSVVNTITAMVRLGTTPTAINMMGWSRGAVTSIRIAYFLSLNPALSGIPVNIFGVDPVAGEGHNEEIDARSIGPNVRNYVATLAAHEVRAGFSPMETNRLEFSSDATNHAVLPLPGIHSDTAKHDSSAGRITFNLCARFLEANGTRLHSGLAAGYRLTNQQVLGEYDKLMLGKAASGVKSSNSLWERVKGGGAQTRAIASQMTPSTFFINAHHKAMFRQEFPTTYTAFFGPGAAQRGKNNWLNDYRRSMFEEMKRMGPAHLKGLDDQLALPTTPTAPHLAEAYVIALVNNQLV
jgi:hypothetical protein